MCFYFGKNAPSILASFVLAQMNCVAANEAMRFPVRSFGCALFYFWGVKEKVHWKTLELQRMEERKWIKSYHHNNYRNICGRFLKGGTV